MIKQTPPFSIRARLFYKSTCSPCQWMSKLAVFLSLGTIHRIPISSEEAKDLYRSNPEKEGQLILVLGKQNIFGPMVFAAVPRCILMAWWKLMTFPFQKRQKTRS